MDDINKSTISMLIEDRLISNWALCDQLKHGIEYDRISNECSRLHKLVVDYNLKLSDYVMMRF